MKVVKESKWDNALMGKLTDLYVNQGISTVEIAKMLGFTKNAIIGKIHRMGLVKNQEAISENKPKIIAKTIPKPIVRTQGTFKLEELEYNMCVWPYGEDEFTFCGNHVVADKPYCEEHLALVYLPPKRTSKRKLSEMYTEANMEADAEEEDDDDDEDADVETNDRNIETTETETPSLEKK